jgi:uncharacterized protein YraI
MRTTILALSAGVLLVSAGAASASPGRTTTDLNLRSGPGTGYAVIDTMPSGARVDIRGCSGSWCRVDFHGTTGWAAANLLAGTAAGYAYRSAPPPVVVEAPPAYAYGPGYWGPDYGWSDLGLAYEPGFSVGFGFGPGWGGGGHRVWRDGARHGGGAWHHSGGRHGRHRRH